MSNFVVQADRTLIRAGASSVRHVLVSLTALQIGARDVTIGIRATGAHVDTLNRFPLTRDGQSVGLRLGDLVSRRDVALVFSLRFSPGREGSTVTAAFAVKDHGSVLQFPETDVIWTYRDDAANGAEPRNVMVDRAVARLYAANARQRALALNEDGRFREAQSVLESVARHIGEYAGDDPVLREVMSELTAGYAATQRR